MGTYQV